KPGANGFPMMVIPGSPATFVEGNPNIVNPDGRRGVSVPVGAARTGHAFLNDIAHNAVPVNGNNQPLPADTDTTICDSPPSPPCQQPGPYDDELLDAHFITGDGRGNENIALSMVHQLFHAEHNRIASEVDHNINLPVDPATGRNAFGFTAQEQANW